MNINYLINYFFIYYSFWNDHLHEQLFDKLLICRNSFLLHRLKHLFTLVTVLFFPILHFLKDVYSIFCFIFILDLDIVTKMLKWA